MTGSSQKDDHSRPCCTLNCLLPEGKKCLWQMPDKLSSTAQEPRAWPAHDTEGQTPLLPHPATTYSYCQLSALRFSSLTAGQTRRLELPQKTEEIAGRPPAARLIVFPPDRAELSERAERCKCSWGSEPQASRLCQPEPACNSFRQQTGASNGRQAGRHLFELHRSSM